MRTTHTEAYVFIRGLENTEFLGSAVIYVCTVAEKSRIPGFTQLTNMLSSFVILSTVCEPVVNLHGCDFV